MNSHVPYISQYCGTVMTTGLPGEHFCCQFEEKNKAAYTIAIQLLNAVNSM